MNEALRAMEAPYLDDARCRLVWTVPVAVLIWIALLAGFSRVLEQTAAPPAELQPIQARIEELPPAVGGLQGAPAAAAPSAKIPPVAKPAPVVHPHPLPHPHLRVKPAPPPFPPSANGTEKSEAPPPQETSSGAAASSSGTSGPSGVSGKGGALIGTDAYGARATYAPVPEIPDDLREETLDTVAVAHFKVRYDGTVEVTLAQRTSNPQLNQILLDTLKQWRFVPATRGGVAIDSEFDVRIPITVQ